MNHPANLHISTLYAGKPATLSWPSVPGATGYTLQRRIGESFEAPAAWSDVELDRLTWNTVEAASYGWKELESYAANTVVYDGANGNATDQGFTWFHGACVFPTMGALDAKGVTWQTLDAAQGAGFCWQDTEFSFPHWNDLADWEIGWQTLENLPCHCIGEPGQIACTDTIPLDAKAVTYRVIAYNNTEQSDWFVYPNATVHPRIQQNATISFQIPPLYEGEAAAIRWSPIPGATRYRLEGRYNQDFDTHATGLAWMDVPSQLSCWGKLEEKNTTWRDVETLVPDCLLYDGPEPAYTDALPTGANTVSYRLTAYNELENTAYSHSGPHSITPKLLRKDKLSVPVKTGQRCFVCLAGSAVAELPPYLMTISYAPNDLRLVDFAAQTANNITGSGLVTGTGPELMSHANGIIKFVCRKTIGGGKEWAGLITLLEFTGLKDGNTQVELS